MEKSKIKLLDLLLQAAAICGKTSLAYLDGIQFGTEFGNRCDAKLCTEDLSL
jgi:hypothetical protein